MVPIVFDKSQKFDEVSFKEFLIDTCRNHKAEGRALVFAFIVYDFGNHTISEIIAKTSYWSSLDIISGNTLSIFYINSQDTYYKRRQEEIYQEELRQRDRLLKDDAFSFFYPITRKATPTDNAIDLIKSEFGLDEKIRTPFVLFFQIDNDNYISDSFIVGLQEERLEDAFLELQSHIKNAVESLAKVSQENYKNHQAIFDLVKNRVKSGNLHNFVNKKVAPKGIGTIFSFIKNLY